MLNNYGFVIAFQRSTSTNEFEISKKGSYVEIIDFNNLSNGLFRIWDFVSGSISVVE